jgi:hypothetical protein
MADSRTEPDFPIGGEKKEGENPHPGIGCSRGSHTALLVQRVARKRNGFGNDGHIQPGRINESLPAVIDFGKNYSIGLLTLVDSVGFMRCGGWGVNAIQQFTVQLFVLSGFGEPVQLTRWYP